MAHIANVKLGKYQVHRIYLGDRIIWEIMPVRTKDTLSSYELTLGQLPVASSLGFSTTKYYSKVANKLNLKNTTNGISSKVPITSHNTSMTIQLDSVSGQGDIEINNAVNALATFYNILFGASLINIKSSVSTNIDLGSLLTITSYNNEESSVSGSIIRSKRDLLTSKHISNIKPQSLMIYAVKDNIAGTTNIKNYTILTNKIPSALNNMQLTSHSFSEGSAIGNTGKKISVFSNKNNFYPITSACTGEANCLPISSLFNTMKDFNFALAQFTVRLMMLGNSQNSTYVCGIGGNRYHFYMGSNTINMKTSTSNIMQCNKNIYMYVTFIANSKNAVLLQTPNVLYSTPNEVSTKLDGFPIKTHIWYPPLGYPKSYNEVTLVREDNRVPLTIVDNSNLIKNRTSILIRQAYSIIDNNDGILEVN